jgi:sugar phosphate isomerase/epimerase
MHRLSLGNINAVGLTTPEIIYLAAELGCEGVTINPGIIDANQIRPSGSAPIDIGGPVSRLDNDPAMRRATAQALADTGVTIDMMEPIGLLPDFSFEANKIQLEIFAELGASRVNIAAIDDDQARMEDNLAAVCELAQTMNVQPLIEFFACAGGSVPSLASAMALIETGRFVNLKLTIDTLHLARAGETPTDLAKIGASLIGAAQISDGPLAHPGSDAYFYEALFQRAIPGEGELPLVELLRIFPPDIVVSPEVPLRALRVSGVPIQECARRAIEGTRKVARMAGLTTS